MGDRNLIWQKGELIARQYLEKKGYKIIEQNYRTRYSEIDLIAEKDNILIFVEVRTKSNELFGTPEETINNKKLNKLYFNASNYVKLRNWQGQYRIDAIGISLDFDKRIARLRHFKDIVR